jgi:tRNA dimethylallyltransferase
MKTSSSNPVVIVAGPTASGKSALALALAVECNGVVINADSQQIYRDIPILSAQPGDDDKTRAPHRLYAAIDARETCSVGRWRSLALAEIDAARTEGKLPILTGGTGLYFEALLNGLAEIPPIPESARATAQALHAQLGGAAFRAKLAELDPETAARLPPGDTQRLTRAYEVAFATGKSLTAWHREQIPADIFGAAAVVLLPPRQTIYAACDARVLQMIDRGAEAEVRALLMQNLAPDLPAMKAVGVREIASWLSGASSRDDAIAAMQRATRQYAKRQYTWFRLRLEEGVSLRRWPINTQYSESLLPVILSFIRQFLLTTRL